jgi:hypothetical protein
LLLNWRPGKIQERLFLVHPHLGEQFIVCDFLALISFPGVTCIIVTTGGVDNCLYDNHCPEDADHKRMCLYSQYNYNYTQEKSYNAEKTPGFEHVFHSNKFEE